MMVSKGGPGAPAGQEHVIPQNLDAEISVLGASMLTPNVIPGVSEIVRPHHFYRQSHQRIFEVIEDLFSRGEPVDPITVSEELANRASLDMVGGRAFIHSLVTPFPRPRTPGTTPRSCARTTTFARSSRSGARSRRWGIVREQAPMELIDKAEQMVFEISQTRSRVGSSPSANHQRELCRVGRKNSEGHVTVGCETGFRDLDGLITGFQPSQAHHPGRRPSWARLRLR